ncbi:tRNA 2-selenouridine synthase [Paenibacillus sp. J31TS4]|uniref:tRNA 2-selenouridine(34) synthase MnmH n=1 Tax=Paenibacillus sp. J31TS4 TaxID=2807195 RepID=UPI001B176324|nr:tRNA 2-selenouridine(34) synthase MnmH [Paenibacillus sp. J31TS4]GIP38098.1 tRNA 2-selenouridine synthase [Paenibacillus sp. J31TS4]
MFQDITIDQLLRKRDEGELTLIDVRSPSEYEEMTIPGSINIPFFTDEERSEIGTLYKQVSVEKAKERGLEIISAKLPAFIKSFQELGDVPKVVYCWRGGMRSRTTATLLSLMSVHVQRLTGGIRSYRKWVVDTLDSYRMEQRCVVIHGYTGSGKTLLLQRLADEGYPVIDLEGLANHRGSIFGHVGREPNNQKTFESLLLMDLLRLKDSPYVILEAESKRVGKACLPPFLVEAKKNGTHYVLELPRAERIRMIVEDYQPAAHKEACLDAFRRIQRRMHTPIAAEIELLLEQEQFEEAVGLLLEHYYDPRYEHAGKQYEGVVKHIQAVDTDDALAKIKEALVLDGFVRTEEAGASVIPSQA